MTQLFNTNAFDDDSNNNNDGQAARTGRHLHSMPTEYASATGDDLASRTTQWRFDDDTIQTGRRGIAMAREALKQTAKGRDRANHKAA